MKAPSFQVSALLALALTFATACDKKSDDATTAVPSTKDKEAEKKDQVDALLRANGFDPNALSPKTAGAPNPQPTPPGEAAGTGTGTGQTKATASPGPRATMQLLNPGSTPQKALRYKFEKGLLRKFSMDMSLSPQRTVNGQPEAGIPPVQIAMTGTSETFELLSHSARRRNTFLEFTPKSEGMPAAMLEQMQAQFSGLKGVQLIETVSDAGQVLDMQVEQGSMNNPQVVALLQNLQDGMANAFLSLPEEPVGVGAKWKGTTQVMTEGITVTQINEMHLIGLKGDTATVELTFHQSAPAQVIAAPGMPPEAKVELLAMNGSGKGKMTVNFVSLVTDSKVDLKMNVDTRISGVGTPAPVLSTTETGMKIHMRITQ